MRFLDEEYENFLIELCELFNNEDAVYVIKGGEEHGEVCEAFSLWKGTNPLKTGGGNDFTLASEWADVAVTALLAIINLGCSPGEFLKRHRTKMEKRITRYEKAK